MEFFTPSQTIYHLANRFLKIAELNLHLLKRGEAVNFHKGNFPFASEVDQDSEKVQFSDSETKIFRLGMHFATMSMACQLLEDIGDNKPWLQSIGNLEQIHEKMSSWLSLDEKVEVYDDYDREELNELHDELIAKMRDILPKMQFAISSTAKAYPFQTLLDMAAHDAEIPPRSEVSAHE